MPFLIVYNFLQMIAVLLAWPLFLAIVVTKEKYRHKTAKRMGLQLRKQLAGLPATGNVIWIHALSVGEVTSALPLVRSLRQSYPEAKLIFSASTSSGMQIAERLISPHVDRLISGPLDFLPVISFYIRQIRPTLFCLIETDFWPNWLHLLRAYGSTMVLANGRISGASFERYRKFSYFFKPLFDSFDLLAMQTEEDVENLKSFGIKENKIHTLGNLKYDALLQDTSATPIQADALGLDTNQPIWICGSTHPGEEELIFNVLKQLKKESPTLILAPRNIQRSETLLKAARKMGFSCRLRRAANTEPTDILILDTLGELSRCYHMAKVAFIGGSIIDAGGHNPLEAAAWGVPTCFGPHMEDFSEIAVALIRKGAGKTITGEQDLANLLRELLKPQSQTHRDMAEAARDLVRQNQGVVRRHLQAIAALYPPKGQ